MNVILDYISFFMEIIWDLRFNKSLKKLQIDIFDQKFFTDFLIENYNIFPRFINFPLIINLNKAAQSFI